MKNDYLFLHYIITMVKNIIKNSYYRKYLILKINYKKEVKLLKKIRIRNIS